MVELNVSFKKPWWNLYKVNTIGAWQKCPFYGDVRCTESPSKNQKSSKVNIKFTIYHDFLSPDLLERPKLTETGPIKKGYSYWTLPHPCTVIQPTARSCKYFNISHIVILFGLAKAIAHHSLTGLNIIIYHDSLIFHNAIIINRKNWRITYKTSFWKSKHFF